MELGVLNIKALKDRRRKLRNDSTKAEILLWKELRNNKIGQRFVRQFSVSGYVIDFYCPSYRFGVELEGGIHKINSNKKYDTYREKYLKAYEVNLMKIPNGEVVQDTLEVIRKIRNELVSESNLGKRQRTHPMPHI